MTESPVSDPRLVETLVVTVLILMGISAVGLVTSVGSAICITQGLFPTTMDAIIDRPWLSAATIVSVGTLLGLGLWACVDPRRLLAEGKDKDKKE